MGIDNKIKFSYRILYGKVVKDILRLKFDFKKYKASMRVVGVYNKIMEHYTNYEDIRDIPDIISEFKKLKISDIKDAFETYNKYAAPNVKINMETISNIYDIIKKTK